MGVGTLRAPIRDATEEEVAEPERSANDDGVTPNPTERIALDGSITNRSHVNLMGKKGKVFQIGTWNVRTMNQDGKLELLLEEADRLHLDVLGLSETKWKGKGSFQPDKNTKILFSGKPSGKKENGVAIILKGAACKAFASYNPISDRVITVRLLAKPKPITNLQAYAPTTSHDDASIEEFYEQMQSVLDKIKKGDVCVVMGDMNAKVGEGEDKKCGIGKFGLGDRNERGDRLAEFCCANNLAIMNTCFKHHKRNLDTWKSPGDRYRNQIDYIMMKRRWKSSVLDAKTYPGADCDTDHILLAAKMRVKPTCTKPKRRSGKLNVKRLNDPTIKAKFKRESEQQFRNEAMNQNTSSETKPESLWITYKTILTHTAEQTIGRAKRVPKKPWISQEVLDLAEEKSKLRKQSNTPTQKQRYKELRAEIQRRIRRDKTTWLDEQCKQIKTLMQPENPRQCLNR
ncbi:craniofacial development protein 2-like [Amphiura filiformis]|uniref:craniofacial development protein 2-like n=1 Tax=Amphiura filiformis TaxID=82378 RepID=UPI003B228BFF